MSDDVLRNKVQDLLEKMERVFHTEWRKTKLNLDHEMIEHFIDAKGSFLVPEGPGSAIPWAGRDALLVSYRSLLADFSSILDDDDGAGQEADVGSEAERSYADVVNAADQMVANVTEQIVVKPVVPDPVKANIPAPLTSSQAIPRPQTGTQAIPGPGNAQWPGPMTAPVAIGPASSQGFPNPFAAAVNKKDPKPPASMQGPNTGRTTLKADPEAVRAIVSREKFSHLLEGVNSKDIRNFILAEGTNSGTGKPTLIIYTLENIWLEFAFPYEEGLRILTKYPQRDTELIEFMKSSGHNE